MTSERMTNSLYQMDFFAVESETVFSSLSDVLDLSLELSTKMQGQTPLAIPSAPMCSSNGNTAHVPDNVRMGLHKQWKILENARKEKRSVNQSSCKERAARFQQSRDDEEIVMMCAPFHGFSSSVVPMKVTIRRGLAKWIDELMASDDAEDGLGHQRGARGIELQDNPQNEQTVRAFDNMNTSSSGNGNEYPNGKHQQSNKSIDPCTSQESNISNGYSTTFEPLSNSSNLHDQDHTNNSNPSPLQSNIIVLTRQLSAVEKLELEYYKTLMSMVPKTATDAKIMLNAKIPGTLTFDMESVFKTTKSWLKKSRFRPQDLAEKILNCSVRSFQRLKNVRQYQHGKYSKLFNWMNFSEEAREKVLNFNLAHFNYNK